MSIELGGDMATTNLAAFSGMTVHVLLDSGDRKVCFTVMP
jgi:hypothetical protein